MKFWQNAGAVQCVLAREVSHAEFKSIRKQCPDIGLEIFIHGAMCMSYSGRCLLSNYITGRPSNRGACAQLCRWKYDVILREKESGVEMPIDEDEHGAVPGKVLRSRGVHDLIQIGLRLGNLRVRGFEPGLQFRLLVPKVFEVVGPLKHRSFFHLHLLSVS